MRDDSSIRGELLELLPAVGHRFGLGPAALDHLLWLIRRTRVMDWRPGNRAVVYKSVAETAAERRITPRQVNNHEREIAEVFGCAVSCPNCRRYGQRDRESGRIVHASGFELTGMHKALPALRRLKAEVDEEHQRRRQRKKELEAARGYVRRLANAVFAMDDSKRRDEVRAIAARIGRRVPEHEVVDVHALESRVREAEEAARRLEAMLLAGKTCGSDGEISDRSEENFRHIDPLPDPQSTLTGGCSPAGDNVAGKPAGAARGRYRANYGDDYDGPAFLSLDDVGTDRIGPELALKAASGRFLAHLPFPCRRPTANDVVDAAKGRGVEIGIGLGMWREACETLGTYPAALCVLLTDQVATSRAIKSPGGYFRAMVRRAPRGELAIGRSIFAIVNAGEKASRCPT